MLLAGRLVRCTRKERLEVTGRFLLYAQFPYTSPYNKRGGGREKRGGHRFSLQFLPSFQAGIIMSINALERSLLRKRGKEKEAGNNVLFSITLSNYGQFYYIRPPERTPLLFSVTECFPHTSERTMIILAHMNAHMCLFSAQVTQGRKKERLSSCLCLSPFKQQQLHLGKWRKGALFYYRGKISPTFAPFWSSNMA